MKPTFSPDREVEFDARVARYGLRVAARLAEKADALPQDIAERLRVAREQAVERSRAARKVAHRQGAPSVVVSAGGSMAMTEGSGEGGGWFKFAGWVPICLLLAGLLFIQDLYQREQVEAAAEIDAALLSDDLPPSAYSDPGFNEFLKSPLAKAD
jgi:hypothetical protein